MTEIEPMPWHTSALDKQITTLITAGNALSLMAQTSGGTAGRDDALCAAVDRWDAEREKAIQARRIVRYEWNDPEVGVGFETVSLPRTPTAPSGDVIALFESALNLIAGSHYERFGIDQTDIEEIPDMSAEDAMNLARDTLMAGPSEYQAAIAAMRPASGVFSIGDRVTKIKGSAWTGRVVGTYSTTLTPEGYAVESENEPGSVQIYPATALRQAGEG